MGGDRLNRLISALSHCHRPDAMEESSDTAACLESKMKDSLKILSWIALLNVCSTPTFQIQTFIHSFIHSYVHGIELVRPSASPGAA